MTVSRGEIWLADLHLTKGSHQSGTRPLLIFQNNSTNRFTATFSNDSAYQKSPSRFIANLPFVLQGRGGLDQDSLALCHQLRVLDRLRLKRGLGAAAAETMAKIGSCVPLTTGIV